MRKIILIYILALFTIFSYAQQSTEQDSLPTSIRLFYDIDFSHSIRFYKQLLRFNPYNPVFYYKLGFAYLNTEGKADSALINFNKAYELYKPKYRDQINRYSLRFYKAYAFLLSKQLDSAARLLQQIRYNKDLPTHFRGLAGKLNDTLDSIVKQQIKISNLGPNINTKYTEHSPIYDVKNNMLLFTSRRKINKYSRKLRDGQYDENIFMSYYNPKTQTWSKAKPIPQIDTIANEASCSFNPDNNIVIIYKDDSYGSLYWGKLINGRWSALHKFPRPINTLNSETHGTITSDGKILYFASDRPEGFGGTDIWMSKLNSDGTWSKPINLGPNINTAGDEDAPFITPDGKHLYFSSTGHNSLGGYDIFVSVKDEFGTWNQAQNLGYPINTIFDDIFFYPVDSVTAFFASNRPGTYGFTDIYKAVYLPLKKDYQINICYLEGFDSHDNITVKISDFFSGETFIAHPNESGKFIFVTQPAHKYKITIENTQGKTIYQEIITSNSSKYKLYREISLNKN